MRKLKKIIIILIISFIFILLITTTLDNNKIRSIKSEKELYNIYNNNYTKLSTIKRILLLPFSIFYNDNNYYNIKDYPEVDYATNSAGDIKESSNTRDYSKTNIQVEGVDEADIVKTDGNYIYSISNNNIIITNTKDSNNIKIESKINLETIPIDIVLNDNKLIIISTNNDNYYNQNTIVNIYDISNKEKPNKLKTIELKEKYYTTRCINNKLYILSSGYLKINDNNKVDRTYKIDNKELEIKYNDIKYIKNTSSNIQTLILEEDLNNLDNTKVSSYLMDISNAYISKDNIYLLDNTYYYKDKLSIKDLFTFKGVFGIINNDYNYTNNTIIYKFNINKDKGIKYQTYNTLEGHTINQYSMDEYNNHLRIALESNKGTRISILDKNLKLIGETDNLAEGEKMYSSRFINNKAYLVTYKNTDPLFVIDLKNEKHPKVLGELKIPGYSTYLHPYDDNHLIGIGMETKENIVRDINGNVISNNTVITGMKMSLFDITDINNPKQLSKTTIGDSRTVSAILTNPKALLFSKEKNLIAIPVNNYNEDFEVETSNEYEEEIGEFTNYNKEYISEGYFVYNIDLINGFKLKGIINHDKKKNDYYYYYNSKLLRGLYIDNDLYTISEDYIKVHDLNNLIEKNGVDINEK